MPATRLRRWTTGVFSILCWSSVTFAPGGATAQELYRRASAGTVTGRGPAAGFPAPPSHRQPRDEPDLEDRLERDGRVHLHQRAARHLRREGDASGVQGVRQAARARDRGRDQPRRREAGGRPAHRDGDRAVGGAAAEDGQGGHRLGLQRRRRSWTCRCPSSGTTRACSTSCPARRRRSSRTPRSTRPHARWPRRSTARTATPTARAWTARRTSSPGCRTTRCTSRRRRRSRRST